MDKISALRRALDSCEAVVIGAGAGLSASAGFVYDGERFRTHFGDFEKRYGFHDMYAGGFYPYGTPEEFWAYWSRYILLNRYKDPQRPVYEALLSAVGGKNYFVITTNVDHCFQKAGFDKERLFYTQGDFGLFQCSLPCHDRTYDNEETVRRMAEEQRDLKVPAALLPRCPVCGRPMTVNLRSDDKFVEDAGWHAACGRYEAFLAANRNKRVLYWEIGVGGNTPGIIKYPFWRLTAQNPQAVYCCVNPGGAVCPREIAAQSILLKKDAGETIASLA